MNSRTFSLVLIPMVGVLCLTPWMPSAGALLAGAIIALALGNPYIETTRRYFQKLLTWSVMGLGAGMNLETVARVGLQGLGYTIIGLLMTVSIGLLLARVLKLERESGILISVGTAICGGSAIAAVAPTIRAKPQSISVALATVFLLNAVALLIFPPIGHWFGLTQTQFGLWSALAIHDTSSVVGATLQYGQEALHIGTTVKLARALWIVPVALATSLLFARGDRSPATKAKLPWFILGFVLAAALVTWIPEAQPAGHLIEMAAKRTLVLALFLIGANLTLETLRYVGFRPFAQGFLLWVAVASATLLAVFFGVIH